MKLAQLYSLGFNTKLSRPDINLQYFNTPADKYIVIHSGGGNNNNFPAKCYDLWQDVINLIKPYLGDIQIIQLGLGNEKPLNNTINLLGQTNIQQSSYIISNSLLLAGNDSSLSHIAGALSIPVVALYGPTSTPHQPYWHTDNSVFLESHRYGNKPSFQANESPKTINTIKPEKVATGILDTLKINHSITQNTIIAWPAYNDVVIEIIPDAVVNPQSLPLRAIHLRYDYCDNTQGLIGNLQSRPYVISTDKPIDLNILKGLKQNVMCLVYEVNKDTPISYLKDVVKLGINLNLVTKLNDEELNKIKL